MRRGIKTIILLVLSMSITLNPIIAKANSFSSAEKRKLNTSFSVYLNGGEGYFYKIKLKKKGKYTISLNTKVSETIICIYKKNGKQICPIFRKKKQKQGTIRRNVYGYKEYWLDESEVTGKFKGSFTVQLKKGTYVIEYYPVEDGKIKAKTSFKK